MDALEAGKHVYCEKPMTRYLDEAFKVYDTVKRTGRIFQVGSQGCSAQGWHKCGELIKAGKIGTLVWGQGYYCRNSKEGEWNYDIELESTPENIDWERWLGRVKTRVPFSAEHYHRWRKAGARAGSGRAYPVDGGISERLHGDDHVQHGERQEPGVCHLRAQGHDEHRQQRRADRAGAGEGIRG